MEEYAKLDNDYQEARDSIINTSMMLAVSAQMDYESVMEMTNAEQKSLFDILSKRAEAMNPSKKGKVMRPGESMR